VDIANKIPPAVRLLSLPDTLTPLWDLFESCWAVDPESRPTAESVMHTQRRWHDDYERDLLKQSPPVQDIADSFTANEDVSTVFKTTPVAIF
jgi:hypothetical protein